METSGVANCKTHKLTAWHQANRMPTVIRVFGRINATNAWW